MKLLDSNIIIYATQPANDFLLQIVGAEDTAVSAISYVETLGYHSLTAKEKEILTGFFDNIPWLPVSEAVIRQAVSLRQTKKMSLGDSLIAATAIIHSCTLVTRNISDFDWIPNFALINPFQPGM